MVTHNNNNWKAWSEESGYHILDGHISRWRLEEDQAIFSLFNANLFRNITFNEDDPTFIEDVEEGILQSNYTEVDLGSWDFVYHEKTHGFSVESGIGWHNINSDEERVHFGKNFNYEKFVNHLYLCNKFVLITNMAAFNKGDRKAFRDSPKYEYRFATDYLHVYGIEMRHGKTHKPSRGLKVKKLTTFFPQHCQQQMKHKLTFNTPKGYTGGSRMSYDLYEKLFGITSSRKKEILILEEEKINDELVIF